MSRSKTASSDTVSYCLSPNEDIVFIASQIHGSFASVRSVLLTTRGFPFKNPPGLLVDSFRRFHGSSASQLLHTPRILASVRYLFGRQNVFLLAPSIWNVPIALLARALGKDLAAAIHDVDPHYRGVRGHLYRIQNLVLLRLAQRVWVFSEFSREQTRIRSSRALVCALPLPSPAEVVRERCLELAAGIKYDFVYFGRVEVYKGASLLPQFAERIDELGLSLLVITRLVPGSILSESLRSQPNVTIIDEFVPLDRLGAIMLECRACVCPCESATQSGVVAFANCLGIPTLAHAVGGISEQLHCEFGGLAIDSVLEDDWIAWFLALRFEDRARLRSAYDRSESSHALDNCLKRQRGDRGDKAADSPSKDA